jgi:anaerobic magnesium-protoporphyrin IX monomethyl ester cyclase
LNPPFEFKISKESRWPEYTKSGTLYYPYWLAYAAGLMMEKSEHEVLLLDAIAKGWDFNKTIQKIEAFKPDLVVIETTTPTFNNDLRFVKFLKERFNCEICLTGTHVSTLPEDSFKSSNEIDFIARREYEYTILDLANTLEKNGNLKNVLGISYKRGKKIIHNPDRPLIQDLDSLPFVSKVYKMFLNIYDYRYALARYPMIQIWSSRGCPNMCTFCLYPQVFSGRIFRARSPKNFVAELEWIKENLPQVKEIFIEDDTFTVDKKRVLKICKLIKEKNLDVVWSANARADIPYDVLKEMKKAGCRMLIIGYESGNQQILNNIKKGILISRAIKFTLDAKKLGIKIFGCFMLGLPGETKETIKQTFNLAKKINPDMAFFQQAVPFPGTEFYDWVKTKGYLIAKNWDDWLDESGRLNFIISYPELTAEDIKNIREELTIKFYSSPKWIAQALLHNLQLDEMIRITTAAKNYLKFLLLERK